MEDFITIYVEYKHQCIRLYRFAFSIIFAGWFQLAKISRWETVKINSIKSDLCKGPSRKKKLMIRMKELENMIAYREYE